MPFPLLDGLQGQLDRNHSRGHPVTILCSAQDGHISSIASQTEQALHTVSKSHGEWYKTKVKTIVRERDTRNVRGALGEVRALGSAVLGWGASVAPQKSGADFIVTVGSRKLFIEVATVLGRTEKATTIQGQWSQGERVRFREVSYAPFGQPRADRAHERIQGNAVSWLAAIKDEEHQAGSIGPTVLWLDLNDPETFPLPLGLDQTQPLIGGGREIVSGVLWWANYGKKRDRIFDSLPIDAPDSRYYALEFPGRFERHSRFAGVIHSENGVHAVLENHRLLKGLTISDRLNLLKLPNCRFEMCWLSLPNRLRLRFRVWAARRLGNYLFRIPR
jgi:hypothetical protein